MLRADHEIRRPDILLATPLHWRRQLKRGYNQSEDLRRALLKLRPDLAPVCAHKVRIKRRRSGPPQAQSSRRSRLVNLEGAFSVIGEVADCSVTLIDDVCTTGATASAVAQALLEAGASDVHLWCFARTASR
ncbi:MAG: ComF family protein [Congregibacter sp.]